MILDISKKRLKHRPNWVWVILPIGLEKEITRFIRAKARFVPSKDSFSDLEIRKVKIADKLLRTLGINPNPKEGK